MPSLFYRGFHYSSSMTISSSGVTFSGTVGSRVTNAQLSHVEKCRFHISRIKISVPDLKDLSANLADSFFSCPQQNRQEPLSCTSLILTPYSAVHRRGGCAPLFRFFRIFPHANPSWSPLLYTGRPQGGAGRIIPSPASSGVSPRKPSF